MPKTNTVLWQLVRYGLPAIALPIAASVGIQLLNGNEINLFNDWDWFNGPTHNHYGPDESQPKDQPNSVRPDIQVPDINIRLPELLVEPKIEVTAPVTVEPNVTISPEINVSPEVSLEFNPELNPEINVSPTLEFNPELTPEINLSPTLEFNPEISSDSSSDFGFTPSLDFAPQVTVPPGIQNNPESTIFLSETNPLDSSGPTLIPTDAFVPEAFPQGLGPLTEPVSSTVKELETTLPPPKESQKSSSAEEFNLLENQSEGTSKAPEFEFQFSEVEQPTISGTEPIAFASEDLPVTLVPQPSVRQDFSPGVKVLPARSVTDSFSHSADAPEESESVPETGMVIDSVLIGLGVLGVKKKG